MEELFRVSLAIFLLLGGLSVMVGGTTLTKRVYTKIFSYFFRKPLNWVRKNWVKPVIRWAGRHIRSLLTKLLHWTARQLWQGVRYVWIRLTT